MTDMLVILLFISCHNKYVMKRHKQPFTYLLN